MISVLQWQGNNPSPKTILTPNELNNLSKDDLIMMHLQLMNSFDLLVKNTATMQKQNEELHKQLKDLAKQLAIFLI